MPKNWEVAIESAFREFHEFLYGRLPVEQQHEQFKRDKYVDYPKFKQMWGDKFGHVPDAASEWGPDLSWHVIRSYIKGMSFDDFVDADDYTHLPQKQRRVAQKTFERIYDTVWNNWYRNLCEEELYWDDQDLARRVLEQELLEPQYPAIFCDEAQDFTRIELELLYRLCLFSRRTLHPSELNRVPFAFAGDQFQTLNPTGFRWDSIKASFVEKFVRSLDPECRSKLEDINYRELSFNYRSTRNIVKLCNSIQLLRSVLFDIRSLQPQNTWQFEMNSPMPVCFERGNTAVMEQLKRESDVTVIVPCDEGEEIGYVNKDSFLNSAVSRDESGVPQNVLSATRAKGLEFNRVVLYGFGEGAPPRLLESLKTGASLSDNPDEALPLEYFINRLYVGASRAKRRLFIIDSPKGFERLWMFARDEANLDAMVARIRDGQRIWKECIGGLLPGSLESWSEDRDDPEENGRRYETEGLNKKDPYLLRAAALSYQAAGNIKKAKECRANALQMEESYIDAGTLFVECEQPEKALRAFWNASEKGYTGIQMTSERFPQMHMRLEVKIVEYFKGNPSLERGIPVLKELVERSEDSLLRISLSTEKPWKTAAEKLIRSLIEQRKHASDVPTWKEVLALAERLEKQGWHLSRIDMGWARYLAGEKEGALKIWDENGPHKFKEYMDAKAAAIGFPANLRLLSDMDKHVEIVTLCEQNPGTSLDNESWRLVALAYEKESRLDRAVDCWKKASDEQGMYNLLKSVSSKDSEKDVATDVITAIVEIFLGKGKWHDAVRLASEGLLPKSMAAEAGRIRRLRNEDRGKLQSVLVKAMARSDALSQETGAVQKPVSDFLKDLLISQFGSWKGLFSVPEAGAAIERAGRIIDALQFYEMVQDSDRFSKPERAHAAIRWVKSKDKQSRREAQQGHEKAAERHARETEDRRSSLRIADLNLIPEYPNLDQFDEETEAPKHSDKPAGQALREETKTLKLSVDDLEFTYYRQVRKLNIQNNRSGEFATIKPMERQFGGEAKFVLRDGSANEYLCDSWRIVCDLSQTAHARKFEIRFIEHDLAFYLPIDG